MSQAPDLRGSTATRSPMRFGRSFRHRAPLQTQRRTRPKVGRCRAHVDPSGQRTPHRR